MKSLQEMIVKFRDARDWKQFHTPKDLAISLVLEATELLELFQWKNEAETEEYLKSPMKREVKEELADVFFNVLLIAHDLNIDLEKELKSKMKKNEKKYPIAKAKGKHNKYTQY